MSTVSAAPPPTGPTWPACSPTASRGRPSTFPGSAAPTRPAGQRLAEAIEEARLRYDVPWFVDAYVRTLRGLVGSFLRAYLPGSGSLWRMAARITAPTLVIAGELDRLVDTRVGPQVAR